MADPTGWSSPQVGDSIGFSGATRRIRTDDLRMVNQPRAENFPVFKGITFPILRARRPGEDPFDRHVE
ncbi:MAG TPA: hypothetical protein VIX59_10305 [Candidatus Binataceae bacterium]